MAISSIGSVLYYAIDGTARVLDDVDGMNNSARLFHSTVQLYNLKTKSDILQSVLDSLKVFYEFRSCCCTWVARASELLSGKAAGLTKEARINLGEGVYAPNVIRVASRLSLLTSDLLGLTSYLAHAMKVLDLGKLAGQVASIPVFGVVAGYTLNNVRSTFGIIGFVLSVADSMREIVEQGISLNIVLKITGDVAKIVAISVIGAQGYVVLGLVANATAAASFITRFVMTSYNIRV